MRNRGSVVSRDTSPGVGVGGSPKWVGVMQMVVLDEDSVDSIDSFILQRGYIL